MYIAVCGELGAGCTEVGQILSKKLSINCISSANIVRSIVVDFRGIHPDESFKEFEQHVLSGEVNLDRMIASKIDEFLDQGDTIVEGRSAFMLLGKADVFKVLLIAPYATRVKHVAARRNITFEEAEEDISESDSERKHMVGKLFGKDWLDPHSYDLVINTGSRSPDETAEMILIAISKR